jgi:hypothetical protein
MRQPSEKYRVSLKLTSGALRTFFLAPGPKVFTNNVCFTTIAPVNNIAH